MCAQFGSANQESLNPMSVLVTGGAGYIGGHMVFELLDAGEQVVVLDDLSTGFGQAVPESVQLIIGNAGDQALVSRLIQEHGIQVIIHFAGSLIVPDSVRDPLAYYRNNTMNTCALIEAAVTSGVKQFVFSSTCAVYGTPAKIPVAEDAPTLPVSPYGSSKLMTEIILRDASKAYGIEHVILRYFNVAGADPKGRVGQSTRDATHLIKVALEAALGARTKVEVFGNDYPTPDGTCIRDYIHVSDLVRAHLNGLQYLRAGGRSVTLNCGYGRGFSVLEVLDTVKRVSGVDFKVDNAARRPGDAVQIVADTQLIHRTLGWQPRFDDLATIIAHALAWERMLARPTSG
jgi:UDP-glucose 4-epimerase